MSVQILKKLDNIHNLEPVLPFALHHGTCAKADDFFAGCAPDEIPCRTGPPYICDKLPDELHGEIAKGVYGRLMLYSREGDSKDKIALKIIRKRTNWRRDHPFFWENECRDTKYYSAQCYEYLVLQRCITPDRGGLTCNIHGNPNTRVKLIAMEAMEETLSDYLARRKLNTRKKKKIIERLYAALLCLLLNHKKIFTDLKGDNVMFKTKNKIRTLKLVDLGSICQKGSGPPYLRSYRPPQEWAAFRTKRRAKCSELTLAWEFIFTVLSVLDYTSFDSGVKSYLLPFGFAADGSLDDINAAFKKWKQIIPNVPFFKNIRPWFNVFKSANDWRVGVGRIPPQYKFKNLLHQNEKKNPLEE